MTTALCEPCIQTLLPVLPSATEVSPERHIQASERSEAEAIRLAQGGDASAFEQIYKAHSRRVYGLCFRMTGNPTLAEDLTQDVFLQVFRKIQTFRAESAFSTWLYRLAVNIVLMRRRIKTLNETSLEARNEAEHESFQRREMGRVDLRLSGVVDRVNLKRALRQLPRGYRQIFLLHDVLGYEHHEIADALGCSIGNSKSQLHKARVRLRTILGKGSPAQLSSAATQPVGGTSKKKDPYLHDRDNPNRELRYVCMERL
jgi:RNA polymerase sigma-70 factor, ECF subfamily